MLGTASNFLDIISAANNTVAKIIPGKVASILMKNTKNSKQPAKALTARDRRSTALTNITAKSAKITNAGGSLQVSLKSTITIGGNIEHGPKEVSCPPNRIGFIRSK